MEVSHVILKSVKIPLSSLICFVDTEKFINIVRNNWKIKHKKWIKDYEEAFQKFIKISTSHFYCRLVFKDSYGQNQVVRMLHFLIMRPRFKSHHGRFDRRMTSWGY